MGCLLTSQFYSPADHYCGGYEMITDWNLPRNLGATHTINSAKEDAIPKHFRALPSGRGVDCAIEAVGVEPTWNICQHVVKEGGHMANVGVHW